MIDLDNRTGCSITALYVSGQNADEWSENYISAPLADGKTRNIDLGFFADEATADGFTLEIETDDADFAGTLEYVALSDGDTVLLYFDGDVLAYALNQTFEDIFGDSTAYFGIWKYDEYDSYISISEDGSWASCDGTGTIIGAGTYELTDFDLTLILDGDPALTLYVDDNGLIDSDGDTLHRAELPDGPVLPSENDPLTEKITFAGKPVSVYYPATMNAHQREDMVKAPSISINAVNEEGTDDWYTNILVSLWPINGYDPYMKKGYDTAKAYMEHMSIQIVEGMYPDKVHSFSVNGVEDCGTYWKAVGLAWMENTVFSGYDGDEPILAMFDIRYVGETGYALVTSAAAISGRFNTYSAIAENIADAVEMSYNFSTKVKAVPAKPEKYSDPGDYGDTFYWYDSDGDIWFWNGYEDVFIGFGDDYYIDDDGQYYESNDAGWDYEDWDDYDYSDYDYWDDWDDYDYDWDYEDWDYYEPNDYDF